MKKIIFILIAGLASLGNFANAQINVNINLGAQPQWGPSGYERADYYYLPDIETYYSVPQKEFVYLNNGQWIRSSSLPSRYSTYNLYSGYKVVMNTPEPYKYFSDHKVKYAKFKNQKGKQTSLRASAKGQTKKAKNAPLSRVKYTKANSYGNNGNDKGNKGNGGGKGKH